MKEIMYKLPQKAIEIIEELAEAELNQVSFFLYLSFCCSNEGYFKAADNFMQRSKSERYHFTRLSEFLQTRGYYPEVPKVDAPKLKFTDLRSGIAAAYEMEIEVTKMYDESIRMMQEIDTMAYLLLCSYMDGQKYELGEFEKMWAVFKGAETEEAQRAAEGSFWCDPMPESASIA